MNVLIVDDIQDKIFQVDALIRGTVNGAVCIDVAASFTSAVRRMEHTFYDLLLLDLMLPIRDHEEPVGDGGSRVLDEIVSGDECKRPCHIIGLSEHENIAALLKDKTEQNLLHIVIYNETDDKWKISLKSKLQYVSRRLAEGSVLPPSYRADIAIMTSSPLVELSEVIRLPGNLTCEFNRDDALDYYTGKWTNAANRELTVIACAAPKMGMTSACVTACKVIERWRPRYLAMAGIAAGTKRDEQVFGDILVAESAFDYGSGKIRDCVTGNRVFQPSPSPISVGAKLHAILQRWEREQLRTDEIRRAWHKAERKTPKIIFGLLASGAAVVQSDEVVKEILDKSRKVIGLEMEAYGVFHAAYLFRPPLPQVIVAKSISDFAGGDKADDWQQYAAFTSARFLYEFFTQCGELEW